MCRLQSRRSPRSLRAWAASSASATPTPSAAALSLLRLRYKPQPHWLGALISVPAIDISARCVQVSLLVLLRPVAACIHKQGSAHSLKTCQILDMYSIPSPFFLGPAILRFTPEACLAALRRRLYLCVATAEAPLPGARFCCDGRPRVWPHTCAHRQPGAPLTGVQGHPRQEVSCSCIPLALGVRFYMHRD